MKMCSIGFPIAIPVYKLERKGDLLSFVTSSRGRKRSTMPATGVVVLEGDHKSAIHAAVWIKTADGRGETTRYASFATEWSRVMAQFGVETPASDVTFRGVRIACSNTLARAK